MRQRGSIRLGTVLLAGALLLPSSNADDPPSSDVVESARARLAQIDVSVSGPAERVRTLGPDDFDLVVDGKRIRDLIVDHICPDSASTEAGLRIPASYLLYFEQGFLTQGGRAHALDLARGAIPLLVNDYDRAMVISSGKALKTYTGLTYDTDELLAALDEIEGDPNHWLPFASDQASWNEIADAIPEEGRGKDRELHWPSERRLERLATVLGYLTDIDSPKVLIYFVDTLGLADRGRAEVVQAANAHGVRIVTVSGIDLTNLPRVVRPQSQAKRFAGTAGALAGSGKHAAGTDANAKPGQASVVTPSGPRLPTSTDRQRSREYNYYQLLGRSRTQLRSIAQRTGGAALVEATGANELVARIHDETSCFTLISFDATGFSEDIPLPVQLRSERRKVKLRTRESIVVQSRKERSVARLVAAFAAPDAGGSQAVVGVSLLPVELQDGSYSALIQIGVQGSSIANATWDLGATILSRAGVRDQFSGRVSTSGQRLPVVLEKLVHFKPGPFEVTAVASETNDLATFQLIGSRHMEGTWPSPSRQLAVSGPITIVQSTEGVFVRDGEVRTRGSRLLAEYEELSSDRPAWALTLLCGDGKGKQTYRATHGVAGSPPVETTLEPGPGCHQLRDRIDAESMQDGRYEYIVQLWLGDEPVQEVVRPFIVGPATDSEDSEAPDVRTSIGVETSPSAGH